VVYNFDGLLGKYIKEAWIDPFAPDNNVQVEIQTMQGSSPPMAKIKAQIDAGRPDADVIPMQLTDYVFATRNDIVCTGNLNPDILVMEAT
jgi:putative spermidine/putrescine transport system substrate-binding protein